MRFIIAAILLSVITVSAAQHSLPRGPLALAYPGQSSCSVDVIRAARSGVNVIIWDFLTLELHNGVPVMKTGQNLTCVAIVAAYLRSQGDETAHLISIGGWNGPHPDPSVSGEVYFKAFDKWNRDVVANSDLGFAGFAGIDWDLEGNDEPTSPFNAFPVSVLDVVGTMSAAAKAAGYIVTLVPPQSYFDVSTQEYDRSLLHSPVAPWHPTFNYQGRNCYAYLVAKYGIDTFDLVSVQLYESWSAANYAITVAKIPPEKYLQQLVIDLENGWHVDFAADPASGLKSQNITVPSSKVVVGLANGWALRTDGKALLVLPEDCAKAHAALGSRAPRGYMFWDIFDDGSKGPDGKPLWMAEGLNKFLHIRSEASKDDAPLPLLL